MSLDLTAVADVGYLADNAARQEEVLKNLGGETISGSEVLALVMAAIKGSMLRTCNNHCLDGSASRRRRGHGSPAPYYASDAKFDILRDTALASSSSGSAAQVSLGTALSRTKCAEDAIQLITEGLAGKLGGILMVPAEELDPRDADYEVRAGQSQCDRASKLDYEGAGNQSAGLGASHQRLFDEPVFHYPQEEVSGCREQGIGGILSYLLRIL